MGSGTSRNSDIKLGSSHNNNFTDFGQLFQILKEREIIDLNNELEKRRQHLDERFLIQLKGQGGIVYCQVSLKDGIDIGENFLNMRLKKNDRPIDLNGLEFHLGGATVQRLHGSKQMAVCPVSYNNKYQRGHFRFYVVDENTIGISFLASIEHISLEDYSMIGANQGFTISVQNFVERFCDNQKITIDVITIDKAGINGLVSSLKSMGIPIISADNNNVVSNNNIVKDDDDDDDDNQKIKTTREIEIEDDKTEECVVLTFCKFLFIVATLLGEESGRVPFF